MNEPIHLLSLGAGVQSSTVATMAAEGLITPMPTAAIFADTKAEPKAVYEWLDWLEAQLPFPVYRVSKGSLEEHSLRKRFNRKTGKRYYSTAIPAFVKTVSGRGMLMRKCTHDFKVIPIVREAKRIGKQAIASRKAYGCTFASLLDPAGPAIIQWIGISTDEASRMKESREPYIKHRWPLIELGMSRADCIKFWDRPGFNEARPFKYPPKSACVFCPYHHDDLWSDMKQNQPEEFERAVKFEKSFQEVCAGGGATNTPFLHSGLLPLGETQFKSRERINHFENECEGMCGV